MRKQHEQLADRLDACAYVVRTIFVKIRARLPMEKEDDPQACADQGKAAARESFEKLKAAYGKKSPAALADWRLEWMTAFDGAIPQDGETERAYLQRQAEAKTAVNRATNKLELATE